MAISFIRTLIIYLLVILAMRVMGKRQIGELQPSELVVAIMISDLATVPLSDIAIPLFSGIIPILTLLIFEVTISFLTLKSEHIRNFITGRPTCIIKDGVISIKEMKNMRYNMEDLLEELRLKDCPNIADVHTAILETNGELSLILRSNKRSVCVEDLKIKVKQDELPLVIISDGNIRKEHLKDLNKDMNWLETKLKERNIKRIKDVFLFSVDNNNVITLQMKDGVKS